MSMCHDKNIQLIDLLSKLRRFKSVITLVLGLEKIENHDKTIHSTFYLNSKAEIIINENDIDDVFKPIYSTIISNTQSLGQGSD